MRGQKKTTKLLFFCFVCVCVCKRHFQLKVPFLLVRNFAQTLKIKINIQHSITNFLFLQRKRVKFQIQRGGMRERESVCVCFLNFCTDMTNVFGKNWKSFFCVDSKKLAKLKKKFTKFQKPQNSREKKKKPAGWVTTTDFLNELLKFFGQVLKNLSPCNTKSLLTRC